MFHVCFFESMAFSTLKYAAGMHSCNSYIDIRWLKFDHWWLKGKPPSQQEDEDKDIKEQIQDIQAGNTNLDALRGGPIDDRRVPIDAWWIDKLYYQINLDYDTLYSMLKYDKHVLGEC